MGFSEEEKARTEQLKRKIKACKTEKPYIFVSYSKLDALRVYPLVIELQDKGCNIWIDTRGLEESVGQRWQDAALQSMKNQNCKAIFFMVSSNSLKSAPVFAEIMYAINSPAVQRTHEGKGLDIKTITVDEKYELANGQIKDTVYKDIAKDETALNESDYGVMEYVQVIHENFWKGINRVETKGNLAYEFYNSLFEKKLGGGGNITFADYRNVNSVFKNIPTECKCENIKDAAEETPAPDDGTEPDPPDPGGPVEKVISLPDFLKKYDNSTFKKETFQQVRLVGQGKYAAYSTPFFDSVYPLVWSFVMKLLEERGEDYLHFVNQKNSGNKNPPFITAAEHQERKEQKHPVTYRALELPGLEGWSMCRHYGQYGWVNDVLRRRMLELGFPLGDFSLEYIPNSDEQTEKPAPVYREEESKAGSVKEETKPVGEEGETKLADEEEEGQTGGITGPKRLNGEDRKKQPPKQGGYSFTLRGERYSGLSLKNMMLTAFKSTLVLHPDKLDLLLNSLRCLEEGIKIGPDAKPSYFRAGETIQMNGRSISIGTSQNQDSVLTNIKKLMQLCGEPEETFIIED